MSTKSSSPRTKFLSSPCSQMGHRYWLSSVTTNPLSFLLYLSRTVIWGADLCGWAHWAPGPLALDNGEHLFCQLPVRKCSLSLSLPTSFSQLVCVNVCACVFVSLSLSLSASFLSSPLSISVRVHTFVSYLLILKLSLNLILGVCLPFSYWDPLSSTMR